MGFHVTFRKNVAKEKEPSLIENGYKFPEHVQQ